MTQLPSDNSSSPSNPMVQPPSIESPVAPTYVLAAPSQDEQMTFAVSASFQGPMPPPHLFAAYQQIDPSFPNRIMAMTEKNLDHIRFVDSESLKLRSAELTGVFKDRGMNRRYALATVLGMMSLSAWLAYLEFSAFALALALAQIVAMATVFIVGRVKNTEQANTPVDGNSPAPQGTRA